MPANRTAHYAALYPSYVIRAQLPLPPAADRMLDIGCDDAFVSGQLQARLRIGADIRPRATSTGETQFVGASALQLPFAGGTFDCVLAFDILEHIEDDKGAMHEMLRVLSDQGTLWFSTPSLGFRLGPSWLTARANRGFGHVRNGYVVEHIRSLCPQDQDWILRCEEWNEPAFRALFVPLHFMHYYGLPRSAAALTRWCYRVDGRFREGKHGHLLGSIRRAGQAMGTARCDG